MDNLVKCGGWSETKDATKEIQSICDEVKCQVKEKTNKKYGIYKAVKYRSQLVAGMNYLIKVHVGCDDYLHIRVLEGFRCDGIDYVLTCVEECHHICDPLIPSVI
ncbi:stefin-C isoform X1 [Larimichthys crocea]|uniref:stefin-C isoform X1 n=1 Tax=Larimichthys crocea TaxID=215358 RepID=UPI000F5EB692|nr:stefin-C isoform X1 [Larimichthys crocea]